MIKKKLLSGLSLSAIILLSAGLAHAEDVKANAADVTASAPNDVVIVTATKRETNLQQTPIAISVLSQTTMANRHVLSLLDLADGGIPSLRVATFEARQSALTVGIRGIVPFDANQTARDQGVGIYLDGIYLGRQQGLNAALFDIARVEVLRGPQGTLFGRNTEGGAVSIISKEPTGEFGGRISGGMGNFGSHTMQAHVNLPEYQGVSIKIDALQEHQDAFVKNSLAGQAGWGQYDRSGGHIAAKWHPTDDFTATLSYDRTIDKNTPFYSQLINYNPNNLPVATLAQINANGGKLPSGYIAPLSPLVVVSGKDRMSVSDIGVPQQPSVDETQGWSANLKYKINPDIEFRSITGARIVDTDQWDNSGGAHRTVFLPNANFSRYSLSFLKQHQFSQEFQLVGKTSDIDWVLGAYYFTEHVQEQAATPTTNKWNADGTGYTINSETVSGTVTSGNQGWAWGQQFLQRASYADAKSYAGFGQMTYTPASLDKLHITLGGRYTKDKRDGVLYMVSGVKTNYTFNYDKSRFDPLAIFAYDLAKDVNVYAKYSTGYRAGGANDRSQNFRSFDAETVKAYEVGSKMEFFDHSVRLNLAAYAMDRKGTQTDFDNVDTNPYLPGTTTPNPTFNLHTEETVNAPGVSKIRGFEADLNYRPIDNLTLGLSYAYTDVKVPATMNTLLATPALYQVYTVFTPKNAGSFNVDYRQPVFNNGTDFTAHLDANYADGQYSFQNESVKTDDSFVVNARLALTNIPMNAGTTATISLWSRNLLDETHVYRVSGANAKTLGYYGNFNPPRTFGIEGTLNF
ncbi:TonB-dependent receptor [Pseudaquidulcibacter saccharophilus]|uniref:TonB-dependent receptor n=1 Tax=Pseudaquidulcibacter saccharophilus TaxID=2831900 RepID=UPI001EFF1857|nr:TonB-dependent receptor [Pseudaquidulcibacter saccharophilus]